MIGALGDSLTCSTGAMAERITELSMENRGLSWSIGGKIYFCCLICQSWKNWRCLQVLLNKVESGDIKSHDSDSTGQWEMTGS